jgi:DNA-binding MarR family transcriptional regulator
VLSYNQIMRVLEQEMTARAILTLSQYVVLLRLSDVPEGRMKMSEFVEAIVYSTGGLTRSSSGCGARGWWAGISRPRTEVSCTRL